MVVRASNSGLVVDDGYFELGCFSKGGGQEGTFAKEDVDTELDC